MANCTKNQNSILLYYPQINSEFRSLGHIQLFIINKPVDPISVAAPLFKANGIMNRSEEFFIQLNGSQSIAEAVIQVEQALISVASIICAPDSMFYDNFIEGTLCIQQKEEEGFLVDVEQFSSFLIVIQRNLRTFFSELEDKVVRSN